MLKFLKNAKTLKIAVCLFMVMTAVFLLADFAMAGGVDTGLSYAAETGLANTDPRVVAARIIRIVLGFLGILTLGLIMYAGWLWMTSAGNEDKIEQAKNILKNAVIGLIIILSSFAIASFVLNQLTRATGANVGPNSNSGVSGGGFGAAGGEAVESTYPYDGQNNVPRNLPNARAYLNEEVNPDSFNPDTANVETYLIESTAQKNDYNSPLAVNFYGQPASKALINFYYSFSKSQEFIRKLTGSYAYAQEDSSDEKKVVNFNPQLSPDGKTLIFDFQGNYLGSPSAVIQYSVTLRGGANGILKAESAGGGSLFGNQAGEKGYNWKFKTGTAIDNTPPRIDSVVPFPKTVSHKNTVVQINFSEAMDPTTVSGKLECETTACTSARAGGFNNIIVKAWNPKTQNEADAKIIPGNFYVSNQYRTVEFLSNDECGLNSCGQAIYCLPGDSAIKIYIKAATLAPVGSDIAGGLKVQSGQYLAKYPYDGATDMAGNSFDGNADGKAEGPEAESKKPSYNADEDSHAGQGDDYVWSFNTDNIIDTTPPEIVSVKPTEKGEIDIKEAPYAEFNKLLMSNSITTASVNFRQNNQANNDPNFHYWVYSENTYNERKANEAVTGKTKVYIGHTFFKDQGSYLIQFNQGIKDTSQNCYYPCRGVNCANQAKDKPCCCFGDAKSGGSCW